MSFEKLSYSDQMSRYRDVAPNVYVQNKNQLLALQIASKLDDKEHLDWYMRLCKTVDEAILSKALSFVIDSTTNTKGKLFMWKVKQLRGELLKTGKITPVKIGAKPKKVKKVEMASLFD